MSPVGSPLRFGTENESVGMKLQHPENPICIYETR
jgi:hypothetical protein